MHQALTNLGIESVDTENANLEGVDIWHLVPQMSVGGTQRVVAPLANACAEAGAKVTLMASPGELTTDVNNDVELLPVSWHRKVHLDSLRAYGQYKRAHKEALLRGHPLIVHAHSRLPAWYAWRFRPKNFVTTHHGFHTSHFPIKYAYNRVMLKGRPTIFVSSFSQNASGSTCPHPRLLPMGVDLDRFKPELSQNKNAAQISKTFRQDHGINEDDFLLFAPTRISNAYDFETLVAALSALEVTQRQITILLSGDIDDQAMAIKLKALNSQATSAKLRVMFLERPIENMAHAYQAANATYAATKRGGSFGLIIAESHFMGTPVLAANNGGAIEQLASARANHLGSVGFDPGDSEKLVSALEAMLQGSKLKEPNTMQPLTENVPTLQTHIQGCLEIYGEIAKRG